MRNIHSMVYNYAHLDTDYLSPLPEYLIPNEIARAETVVTHTSNEAIHVTAEEKEAWNNMMNTLGQNLILTDSVTGINYLITIVNGKLTL